MDYIEYFERGVRKDTGQPYYFLKEEAPEDLKELIYEIHKDFDSLPNDWIYEQIREAFQDLKMDDLDNCLIEADVYDNDLYKWLGEPFADGLCNECLESGNIKSIWSVVAVAQYLCKKQIYEAVDAFITYQDKHAEV